jgi:hypothetical protein
MMRRNVSFLVTLLIQAWMICLARAAFLMKDCNSLPWSLTAERFKTAMTDMATTVTITSNWWPPSSRMSPSTSFLDKKQGIVPESSREFELYHQRQQNQFVYDYDFTPTKSHYQALPHDPLAATMLRNIVHQAACDALIYNKRWKFCMAVWDDRLLDWLIEAACPGNFWTPRTYLILATAGKTTTLGVRVEEHLIWHHWEGTKVMFLSSDGDPSDGVKKLRSLASRVLPRMSNSGHRATDLPVFDIVIITSSQLLCLLDYVESKSPEQADRSSKINNTHRTKRKKSKLHSMPWVISLPSNPLSRNMLSWNALQAAKQVVVVHDTDSWNVDWNGPLREKLPQFIWLGTLAEGRDRLCMNSRMTTSQNLP